MTETEKGWRAVAKSQRRLRLFILCVLWPLIGAAWLGAVGAGLSGYISWLDVVQLLPGFLGATAMAVLATGLQRAGECLLPKEYR